MSLRRNPYDVATGELPPPQGEYGVEFSSPEAYLSCRDDPRPKSDGPSRSGRDPPPLGPRAGEHRHIPDPAPVFDVLNAFRKSQVLFASVQLGVYDALAAAQAPCCVEDVLTRLSEQLSEPAAGVSLDGLSRLLNANVAIGFVLCADGRNYSLAAVASEFLTTASPRSLAGYALHAANVVWPLFGNLAASVRSGGDAWQETFGLDARDCFGHLYR